MDTVPMGDYIMGYPLHLDDVDPAWLFMHVLSMNEVTYFSEYSRKFKVKHKFSELDTALPILKKMLSDTRLYCSDSEYSLPLMDDKLMQVFNAMIPLTDEELEFETSINTGQHSRINLSDGSIRRTLEITLDSLDMTREQYFDMKSAISIKVRENTLIRMDINDPLHIIHPNSIVRLPTQ